MAAKIPKRELLFSLTKKDFIVEYYNGTGDGGQNRNKVATACRIHHPASGAISACQEERTQKVNRERAFERLLQKPKFKKWLKVETARRMGDKLTIEECVEKEMRNVKVEVRDENGRFVVVDEQHFIEVEKAEGLLKQLRGKLREETYEV
jgi:protein subunit release factor B